MTRAQYVTDLIEKWGGKISDEALQHDEFHMRGCDGFDCPPLIVDDEDICMSCPYKHFWEEEVEDD